MIRLIDTARLKRILCLGAHSDDVEIGCGGTLLRLMQENPALHIKWVVFCGADARRATEARDSANRFLAGAAEREVIVHSFRDGYLPWQGDRVKDEFEAIKKSFTPDLIFTQYRDDRHQDHRILSDLAWNTWRDHQILEYEILKYDGDLGRPNVYAPVPPELVDRKVELLLQGFPTQAGRQWFTDDTFRGLMRVRGVECNSPTKFAEAFYGRKILL